MKVALFFFVLIIVLPMGYVAMKFVEAKGVFDNKILDSQSSFYEDPGASTKRDAAFKKARTSPECIRVSSFAKFAQLMLRGQ